MAGAPIGNDNRNKGRESTRALERALQRRSGVPEAQLPTIERFEVLVECWDRQIEAALAQGDLAALNAMTDRLEGKPKVTSEVSGPDGGAIPVIAVEWADGGEDPRQVSE